MAKDNKSDGFALHAAAVARQLLGEPNKHASTDKELRFGSHGSMSLDVDRGTFFDHEAKEGGGVLWLIERIEGKTVAGGNAVEWLRDNGYYVEDRSAPPAGSSYERSAPDGDSGGGKARSGVDRNGNWLPPGVPDHAEQTAVYPYRDRNDETRYEVVRFDWADPSKAKGRDKTFRQRKPDASKPNGYDWKVKGTLQLPYRLPELLEDIAEGNEIFFVEGEKKVDMLRAAGVPATCNTGGSGKFPEELVEYFVGARLTIIPDNDESGLDHQGIVGNKLLPVAEHVRTLALPGLPPKGSVDDWLPLNSADELYRLASISSKHFEAVPFHSKFGAVEWLDMDNPGPVYGQLIKGVLTDNEISLLLGESQSGKSFIAIDIAMCVARGIPWMDHRAAQGGVIYQAGESATGVRRKRFPAYRQHYDVAGENLPVVLLERPLDLYSNDDHVTLFIEECLHWGKTFKVPLKLIVIDTFSRATPGANENDGKDMGIVLERCDRIRRSTGAHVMLVHHLNAGGTKARGHTSLFANVENVILVKRLLDQRDANGREIREAIIAKQKDGTDNTAIKFVLPQVVLGKDADGDQIDSCIIARPSGEAGVSLPPTGGITLGGDNAVVLRAVYDAIAAHGETPPLDLGLHPSTKVVPRAAVTEAMRASEWDDSSEEAKPGEDEKTARERRLASRRKKAERARAFLYSKGIIGVSEHYIWLKGKSVKGFEPAPGSRRAREIVKDEAAEREALPFTWDADEDGDF